MVPFCQQNGSRGKWENVLNNESEFGGGGPIHEWKHKILDLSHCGRRFNTFEEPHYLVDDLFVRAPQILSILATVVQDGVPTMENLEQDF
jgi:hypothetical protein